MSADLSERVAVVTGAGSVLGLGHAIASELARRGASVVVHDVALPEESSRAIEAAAGVAVPFASDLSNERGVAELVRFAASRFGRLDILVNNAAIGNICGPLDELAADDWDRLFSVNLRACFFGMKHAVRQMRAQGRAADDWGAGRIVSIASQAAKSGFALHAAYSASKHGLLGLTRAAAVEFGPSSVTVNAICPNHMDTEMGHALDRMMSERMNITLAMYRAAMVARVPLGRLGRTSDTATVCGFLCSKEAAYITGEAWNVSGGEEYH